MSKNIEAKQYLWLAHVLAIMRMKSQAKKLVLSYIWWVLEPLMMVALFYILFSVILNRGGDDYFSFMIIGKIIFLWFSKCVTVSATSLISNKGILSQRAIPKWVFPLSSVQEMSYKSSISILLLMVVLLFNGHYPTVYWLQLLPLLLVTYLLIISIALLSSLLVSVAQDFNNLISIGMLGLMFVSGIFWDINDVHDEKLKFWLLLLNPLLSLINQYRNIIMFDGILDWWMLVPSLFLSIVVLSLCLYLFDKFNNKITRCLFS